MPNITLNYSSELMKNYLHAEIISPQQKFEALQTSDGLSLLFAIGTDGVFNLVKEQSGVSVAGWSTVDLSSAQIKKDFSGQANVTCRTFDAGQSAQDGSLELAMVVNNGTNDRLYLCLGNSNQNIAWTDAPAWVAYDYDNPNKTLSKLSIVNVFFCELSNSKQYIIVDVLRDPSNSANNISRFYIDPSKASGYCWNSNDLPVDVQSDQYTSCVGRLPNGMVDGLYTAGHAVNSGQLVFCPIINIYGGGPPTPVRLNLPGGVIPTSIAATRNADLSTDLYATGGDSVYYFASTNQKDSATGVLLLKNDLFIGATHLYAYKSGTKVYLWALNQADQVFYTCCDVSNITTANAWSYAVPILTNVDLISPYVNLVNNGNTFFTVGGDTMYKMIQSPTTGIWASQRITLPAPSVNAPAQKFSSYTTTISATNNFNRPVANSPLMLSAITRSGFFINNLYFILDTVPIPVNTDAFGNITIIEAVDSLTGIQIIVAEQGGTPVQINPMEKPFNKVAQLNSVANLQNAVITNDDGSTTPLVGKNVPHSDLLAVAQSNQGLSKAYSGLNSKPNTVRMALAVPTNGSMLQSFPDAILAEAGDILAWLESGVEALISIVEDVVEGVWNLIVTIAGKVYRCIIDSVETIIGAVEWVFDKIKTAIRDLINYLEFLFGWDDILITHNVMKKVFTQMAQNCVDSVSGYKADIVSVFQSLQNDINKWADIPNFDQTPGSTTSSNPPLQGQNSSPANLGLHHFQGNAKSVDANIKTPSVTESIFDTLLALLNSEEATLIGAYNAIKTDIIDQFDSLTVTQIIQKFIAIIVDTLLQTAENILLAVIDVFVQLIQGIMDVFTATIEIPVLSWLYKEISGNDLSFLDLICLIAAIPATIVFKIGSKVAPFPKGDPFTNGLLAATSFDEVKNMFYTTGSPPAPARNMLAAAMATTATGSTNALAGDDNRTLDESKLKVFGVVTGFFALIGGAVLIVTTTIQRIWDELGPIAANGDPVKKAKRIVATVAAFGNVAYVSPNIATFINLKSGNWYQQMNNALTGISIVKGFVNIPLSTVSGGYAKISPFVETLINTAWNVPVIMNIIDNKNRATTDYKSLIPESIGNFAFNIGGMMEFPITFIKEPKTKAITSLVQYAFMAVYGICMPIAGGIYEWAPGQNHS